MLSTQDEYTKFWFLGLWVVFLLYFVGEFYCWDLKARKGLVLVGDLQV